MIRVLIIEDEAPAASRIENMVREIDPDLEICAITDSITSSVDWLNANPHPDLILMDIELSDGQSFLIFEKIPQLNSTVVFTTAYDEYALKAFKVNSIDYLLKPVRKEELNVAIDKFKSLRSTDTPHLDLNRILRSFKGSGLAVYKQRFLVRQGQRLIPLEASQIAYFYTEDKVSFIKTFLDQRFVVDNSLDELEELLDPEMFYRANRQYIVSPKSLDAIHPHFNGKLKLNLKPTVADEVYVSREKAGDFKKWLGDQ